MTFGVAMKQPPNILQARATIDTANINPTDKTFPVVFATETPVFRSPWWADESFNEVLVCDKKSIRAARLQNEVVPFVDTHDTSSIEGQYGRAISWEIKDNECRAVIQYSDQDSKADLWKDILSGKIKGISVGYRVWQYERVPDKDPKKTPTYRAVDWEPIEISMVPAPADPYSSIRSEGNEEVAIKIINQTRSMTPEEVAEQTRQAAAQERQRCKEIRDAVRAAKLPDAFADELTERMDNGKPLGMDAVRAAIAEKSKEPKQLTQEDMERAVEEEQKRSTDIRTAVRNAKLPDTFADELVARKVEGKLMNIDQAKAAILDRMAQEDPNIAGPGSAGGARAKGDEKTQILNAMSEGMMQRVAPGSVDKFYKLDEETKTRTMDIRAHDYKHMNFVDIGRTILKMNGENPDKVASMSKSQIAERALDTTDLPDLFTSTVKRFLRMYYEPTVPEWQRYSKPVTADDFRVKTGVKFDAAVTFEEIGEDGEYKEANLMSDEKAQIQLQTYARMFGITRKTIINDDLGVLTDIPRAIGIGAKQFQSRKVWAMITGNVVCPDGQPLFCAKHGNLATGANASTIVDAALSYGRTQMRRQKSPQGNELDINPAFLLVPPELETTAQKLLRPISPTMVEHVNIWSTLAPDVNVYLTDPNAWYLIANKDATTVDGMVHSYLSGQEGLYTDSYIDKKTDKVVIKCRLDFACSMWGSQGWFKNTGAAPSGD